MGPASTRLPPPPPPPPPKKAQFRKKAEDIEIAMEALNERLSRFIKWTEERLNFIEGETRIPEKFPVISPAQTHTP